MARCFICGSPAQVGNFCKNCYRDQHPIVKHFKPLNIKACMTCSAINIEGKWIHDATADTVPAFVRKRVNLGPEYKLEEMTVEPLGSFEGGFHPVQYEVKVRAKNGKHEFEQTYEFPLQFEKGNCDHCLRAKSTYFEGTLQVRGSTAVVEQFIDMAIERGEANGNFLVKKDRHKDGFDYYFTKNKFTRQLAASLKKQFGGKYTLSRRLQTRDRQTSKEMYRLTLLYQSPLFFKDEVISTGRDVYHITSTTGTLTARNLGTGKTEKLDPKLSRFTRLVPHTTTVSKVQPQLEVLHPISYQSVPVVNPKPKNLGERVRVVYVDESKVYFF